MARDCLTTLSPPNPFHAMSAIMIQVFIPADITGLLYYGVDGAASLGFVAEGLSGFAWVFPSM